MGPLSSTSGRFSVAHANSEPAIVAASKPSERAASTRQRVLSVVAHIWSWPAARRHRVPETGRARPPTRQCISSFLPRSSSLRSWNSAAVIEPEIRLTSRSRCVLQSTTTTSSLRSRHLRRQQRSFASALACLIVRLGLDEVGSLASRDISSVRVLALALSIQVEDRVHGEREMGEREREVLWRRQWQRANEKECRSSASTSQSTQSTPNVYVLLRVYEMTRFYSEASSYLYAVFISLGLRWRLSIEHETDRRTSSAA